MHIQFLKFILTTLLVFASIHLIIYYSLLKLVHIKIKLNLLKGSLVFLALSFIVFSAINHFFNNIFSRVLAASAGVWFVYSIYLASIFTLIWIARFILNLFNYHITEKIYQKISTTLMIGTLCFTLYGVYLAYIIKVTTVHVQLKSLPENWRGKKVLQISDLHLGGSWGEGKIKKIKNIIVETKPDIVVITGDLFDGSSDKNIQFIEGLSTLTARKIPYGIYFTSGNHEIYSGYEKSIDIVKQSGIIPLENKTVNLDGLLLIGVKFPDFSKSNFASEGIYQIDKDPLYNKSMPSVLLYHVPTEIAVAHKSITEMQQSAYTHPDTNFTYAQSIGIDLQLSGHTHAGQFFPFRYITDHIFNGFSYGLQRVNNFQIYIHAGTGTWGPPVRHIYPSEVALIILNQAQ